MPASDYKTRWHSPWFYFALDYLKTRQRNWQQEKIKAAHAIQVAEEIDRESAAFLEHLRLILLGGLGDLKKVKIVVNKPVRNL